MQKDSAMRYRCFQRNAQRGNAGHLTKFEHDQSVINTLRVFILQPADAEQLCVVGPLRSAVLNDQQRACKKSATYQSQVEMSSVKHKRSKQRGAQSCHEFVCKSLLKFADEGRSRLRPPLQTT
jgi:hypothetical protein